MYSFLNRLNAVFFYAVTVLFFAAAASSITTLWFTPAPKIFNLKIASVNSLKPVRETRFSTEAVDRAIVTLDLHADLRGVWNWNVKQLFVYVTASFETPAVNGTHEVVLWDTIVTDPKKAQVRVNSQFNKYPLIDRANNLRGKPVTLSLAWDVMPITGYLYSDSRPVSRVRMPGEYCNDDKCRIEYMDMPGAGSTAGGGAAAAASSGAAAGAESVVAADGAAKKSKKAKKAAGSEL